MSERRSLMSVDSGLRSLGFGSDVDLTVVEQFNSLQQLSEQDARRRADEVNDPNVARARLVWAVRSGDALFAKALADSAKRRGWTSVAAAYSESFAGFHIGPSDEAA